MVKFFFNGITRSYNFLNLYFWAPVAHATLRKFLIRQVRTETAKTPIQSIQVLLRSVLTSKSAAQQKYP